MRKTLDTTVEMALSGFPNSTKICGYPMSGYRLERRWMGTELLELEVSGLTMAISGAVLATITVQVKTLRLEA